MMPDTGVEIGGEMEGGSYAGKAERLSEILLP